MLNMDYTQVDYTQAPYPLWIATQILARGVKDSQVLDALCAVPRELFVPETLRSLAYEDAPLPIGYGQTISQPYVVAYMSELAAIKPQDRVLEIGTGSGYQAAILGTLAREVFTLEVVADLAKQADGTLKSLGFSNVTVKHGDGYRGWPEHAPYDVILITAAPPEIPTALTHQLAVGGRLISPVGGGVQRIVRLTKTAGRKFLSENLLPVQFVPMVHPPTPDPAGTPEPLPP